MDDRRSESRTELHRIWRLSVDSDTFAHRLGHVLDYSASGMRLCLDGDSILRLGEQLQIHYPGTGFSYRVEVAWARQKHHQTIVGAHLLTADASSPASR